MTRKEQMGRVEEKREVEVDRTERSESFIKLVQKFVKEELRSRKEESLKVTWE